MDIQFKKIVKQLEHQDEPKKRPFIRVRDLYEDNKERLKLQVVNSEYSFDRKIREQEINRPGLALSGFVEVFTYWRVQIMGNAELGYLNILHGEKRASAISTVLGFDLPCIIVTDNNKIPNDLVQFANNNRISIFVSSLNTTAVIRHLSEYLDSVFSPFIFVHGSLVDVFSVGMLFIGKSAIGKSELTLDLIERGHQLVADDAIQITKIGTNVLRGAPKKNLAHHMEIRGIGIIDVYRMFGVRGIRGEKDIHVVVQLERLDPEKEYERIGVDEKVTTIMDVEVPLIELPIIEGKNITVVAEAIAMNVKLQKMGHHPAREFNEQLIRRMSEPEDDYENEEDEV